MGYNDTNGKTNHFLWYNFAIHANLQQKVDKKLSDNLRVQDFKWLKVIYEINILKVNHDKVGF